MAKQEAVGPTARVRHLPVVDGEPNEGVSPEEAAGTPRSEHSSHSGPIRGEANECLPSCFTTVKGLNREDR